MRWFMTALLTGSAVMSAVILLYLALLPALSRRVKARGLYRAGLILAAGLLVPFRVQVVLPLPMPRIEQTVATAPREVLPNTGFGQKAEMPKSEADAPASPGRTPNALWAALFGGWLAVAAALALGYATAQVRFARFVARWSMPTPLESQAVFDNVCRKMGLPAGRVKLFVCGGIRGPMLLGLFGARVLLPAGQSYAPTALTLIFRHEMTHYRRKDLWGRLLFLLAAGMHWFNPLAFLLARAMKAQCAHACDAALLEGAGETVPRRYLETILQAARPDGRPAPAISTSFCGGKQAMKQRILGILETKRNKLGVSVVAVALVLSLAAGAVLAAPKGEPTESERPAAAEQAVVTIKLPENSDIGQNAPATRESPQVYPFSGRAPQLEFFIQGEDLARVDVRCETEFLSAVEWLVIDGGPEKHARSYPVNGYDQRLSMAYDEGFDAYEDIWYRWTALHYDAYAMEMLYYGPGGNLAALYGIKETADITGDELAAHISQDVSAGATDGFPEEMLSDTITVTVTDRNGRTTVRRIHVQIGSGEDGLKTMTVWVE